MDWLFGYRVSRVAELLETVELFVVLVAFIGTLVAVYYIQRWIGDY